MPISHNRYTLLNHHAVPMFELAKARNVAVINAAPYASGILAKGASKQPLYSYMPASDDIKSRANAIEALCAKYAVPMGRLHCSSRCARPMWPPRSSVSPRPSA